MESKTVKELQVYAKKLGVTGVSKYKKADLIKVIKKNAGKCPVGKIRNPDTNRCVLKRGKIGQSLLNKSRPRSRSISKPSSWKVYTKDGCSYCKKAKDLLGKHKLPFETVEITDSNRKQIYNIIDKKTDSYRYFPVIFKNKKFIGGYTELEKMLV